MTSKTNTYNIKQKIHNILLNQSFSLVSFIIGFIAILTMIGFGTVVSIIQNEPWEKVEGCVENSFLAFCLLLTIIVKIKGNHKVEELLIGELLAIFLVTNTTYFIEMLIEVINKTNNIIDIVYLIIEALLMISSLALFIDHLDLNNSHIENISKLIIKASLVLIAITLLFDIIAIFIYKNTEYILKIIDELIYVIFGFALRFAILSIETIKNQKKE